MIMGKMFNYKFFLQNIKKSKSVIIFLVSIIVLFNTLSIMVINNKVDDGAIGREISIPSFASISITNIIALYVFPIVLSCILFGFVYKKNSVDYINSMPISRTSLFITNTIGGICIIIATIMLSALIILGMSLVYTSVCIPFAMILDYAWQWIVGFIFVFIATNLAMCVSGNVSTQLVVTALILFFIPFLSHYAIYLSGNMFDINLLNDANESIGNLTSQNNICNYTLPYNMVAIAVNGNTNNETNIYNSTSNIKMIVLSVLYIAIGVRLYNKRKMEVSETSFKSIHVHNIVKCLTMFPIIFLTSSILEHSNEFVDYALIIAVILAYYYVYDLITKRQITRFRLSILYLVGATIAIMTCKYLATNHIYKPSINVKDIAAVRLNDYTTYQYHYNNELTEYEAYVEDDEFIQSLISNITPYIDIEDVYENDDYEDKEQTVYTYVNIKTKSGKKYSMTTKFDQTTYNNIRSKYNSLVDRTVKIPQNGYNIITVNDVWLTEFNQEELLQETLYSVNNLKQQLDSYNQDFGYITMYKYEKHKLNEYILPLSISEKLLQQWVVNNNKAFAANVQLSSYIHIDKWSNNVDNKFYYDLDNITSKIIAFSKKYVNSQFDNDKPYAILECNLTKTDRYSTCKYYTNQVEELLWLVESQIYNKNEFQQKTEVMP